jgi:2-(1,2-epoxy-1,2-dihydrophenyl)acetyl-CoA isomerase
MTARSPQRAVMTEPAFADLSLDGPIATMRLNRPATRNAIATVADCDAVVAALREAQANPDLQCLILTGAGTAFCAGGDLKALASTDGIGPKARPEQTRQNYERGVQQMIRALWDCELPMIAALNGPAMGLGLDIACLCDLRISVQGARFASSFVKLGIIPGDGGAWILPRAVGQARAAEMILTGDAITADEALACGLVSRVVSADELLTTARQLADRITANPAPATRLAKRLLREGQHQRLHDVLALSSSYQALAHTTPEHQAALAAALKPRNA